jgi:hypothetical protein
MPQPTEITQFILGQPLSDRLPPPARDAILDDLRAYLTIGGTYFT